MLNITTAGGVWSGRFQCWYSAVGSVGALLQWVAFSLKHASAGWLQRTSLEESILTTLVTSGILVFGRRLAACNLLTVWLKDDSYLRIVCRSHRVIFLIHFVAWKLNRSYLFKCITVRLSFVKRFPVVRGILGF